MPCVAPLMPSSGSPVNQRRAPHSRTGKVRSPVGKPGPTRNSGPHVVVRIAARSPLVHTCVVRRRSRESTRGGPTFRPVAILVSFGMTVALAGCSGSAAENDERLVRSYIASLNSGDIANAMMLRCPLAQVEESKRQLFAEQVDRLRIAAGGSLDVATLERVKKPNLDDFSGHGAQREIRSKLKSDGDARHHVRPHARTCRAWRVARSHES
jgi:hypothetical protein